MFSNCYRRAIQACVHIRPTGQIQSIRGLHAANLSSTRKRHHVDTTRRAEQLQRRIEAGRINNLLRTVDKYTDSGNHEAVQTLVHGKLGMEEFHNPSRSVAFEKLITLLVSRQKIPLAFELFERMIAENIVPSTFIRVKMEALAIVHSTKATHDVHHALKEVFADGSYDASSLRELIETLHEGINAKYPPDMIERIVKLFLESQGPTYKPPASLICQLVDLLVRSQSTKHVAEWLDLVKELDSADDHPSPSPHAAFLQALAETDPTNVREQVSILDRMDRDGITPTTSVYNALIAAQISQHNFQSAFDLYATLMQLRPTMLQPSPKFTILPDATTFRFLFRAIKLVQVTRGMRSRAYKKAENAVTARHLYADMVESHVIHTGNNVAQPSPALNVSVLHLVLRTFMLQDDYSAALVVLRSLELYNIQPNLKTYQIVIKGLLRRMHRELASARPVKERRWADVLLGLEEDESRVPGMTGDMVVQLVQYGLDGRITLDPLDDIEDSDEADHWIAQMPSLALIMGQRDVPRPTEDVKYTLTPLQRILRRALLAQATFHFQHEIAEMTPAQLISKVITRTKESLLRPKPDWMEHRAADLRKFRSGMFA